MFQMPAQYMFKDLPKVGKRDDYIAYTLEKMDEFNIEKAMLGVDEGQYETQNQAVKQHPDRFFASYDCNPNNGMEEVRKIRRLKEEYDIKSVNAFPSGLCPQVSLADKHGTRSLLPASISISRFAPVLAQPGPRIR